MVLAQVGIGASALAAPSAPVYNPATNNYYAYVTTGGAGITWLSAAAEAATFKRDNVPGHLVALSSAAENQWIVDNMLLSGVPGFPNGYPVAAADRYWLGGYQPPLSTEPAGGWRWVTGETFTYTNWNPSEPNNGNGSGEERLAYWRDNYTQPYDPNNPLQPPIGVWNDEPSSLLAPGYVIEWETPVPFVSAGPLNYAYSDVTRANPGSGGPVATFSFWGLDVRDGSTFNLGPNETLNLSLDGVPSNLLIGAGATYFNYGVTNANVQNLGLLSTPDTRSKIMNTTFGGVVRVVPPAQSALLDPNSTLTVNAGTLAYFGGAGFALTNGGGGGAGVNPGNYLVDSPRLTNNGTLAWDGRLAITVRYNQGSTGTMRVFIAGNTQGVSYNYLTAASPVDLDGTIQVVLEPGLFNYVPNVGTTFDVIHSDTSLNVAPGGLTVQTLMTAASATALGLSLPPYTSGFGSDPNQLVVLPSNLFTTSVVSGGHTLRLTLAQPLCVPLVDPSPVTMCPGGPASFTVVSKGSGPTTYQWRKNGVNVGGATSSTYSIPSVNAGHAGDYDCVVTSPCGAVTSGAAALTVNTLPTTSNPSPVDACVGATASFFVSPSGTAPFTFQWRKNSVNIGGATSSTYIVPAAGAGDVGLYDCVVTNGCGSVTSGAAALAVVTPASVASNPSPQTVCSGSPLSLSVTAGGTAPFTYQWRKNTVDIGGATSATFAIASAAGADAGSYDCVVSNSCGSATSSAAAVTVNLAVAITGNPAPVAVCAPSPASFAVTATGSGTLTYQWRKNSVNIGGATGATYSLASTVEADAGLYDCVVTNLCGSVASAAASLVVNSSVTSNPAPQTVCVGSPASFAVTASGSAPFTYQWRKDSVNIPGATSTTYSIPAAATTDAGSYDCVITNPCGAQTSSAAALTVNTPATIGTNPSPQTTCVGSPASLSVVGSGSAPFTYQWRKNSVNVPGATSATLAIASALAADAGSYDCVVTNSCGNATSAAAILTVNTLAAVTTNPTPQTVCAASPASFSVVASGTAPITYQWRKNTVHIGGATSATFAIPAAIAGDAGSYDCVVTNSCGSATSLAAALVVNIAPGTSNPSSVDACVGSSASFSVVASGSAPFTYQWRKDLSPIGGATSASYAIPSAALANAGSYDCVVTNSCGTVTSSAATLVVRAPASFSANPSPQAVCPGSPASFGVTATGGAPYTYQWRKNAVNIAGATSATYAIAAAAAGDVASYDCVVTNVCGGATSTAAALTLNTAASVGTNPSSQTVCAGSPASFGVVASGSAPFTYQWRKGGINISGATSATYTIPAAVVGDVGAFDCVITNSCGSATSSAATLTVNTAASVATNPSPQTVCAGSPASFSVTASGTAPFTYQWRKDGVNIGGATSASYAVATAVVGDAGFYDCVITNSCGSATSTSAALTVNTAASIASNPSPQTVCSGSPASFSVTALGTAPITYQWRKNSENIGGATSATYNIAAAIVGDVGNYDCVITNSCGSATSTAAALVVNTSASVASGPSPQTVCAGSPASFSVTAGGTAPLTYQWRKNSVNIGGATSATFDIAAAEEGDVGSYDCVVTNACGSATSSAASLTVNTSTTIASNPSPQTVCAGSPASFAVTASGTAPFTYQWRKNTVTIDGATSATYNIAAAVAGDVGNYDCVVTNACGGATSTPAALAVDQAPSITTQPVASTAVCFGQPLSLNVVATGAGLTYQWTRDGTPVGTSATLSVPAAAPGDAGSYVCSITGTCGSIQSTAASVTVNTAATVVSAPVTQSVCEGSPASLGVTAGGTAPFTYQWRKNTVDIGGATSATYAIATVAGADAGSYDCVITNSCGSATSSAAVLTVNTSAAVASNPATQTACAGSPASFSVTASGTEPFTYQWRKNTVNIGGATSSTYAIAAAVVGDAGNYDCILTNSCGSATSTAASLTVSTSASVAGDPSSQTVCSGSPAVFSVTASGTAPVTYQWRKDAVDVGGATSATFSIAAAGAGDAGSYDCVVTNACGSATSTAATLTVNTSASVASDPSPQTVCAGSPASFTVAASGTAPFTYQWRKNSVNIGGATLATFNIAVAAAGDVGNYDCVVANACGSATSSAASLAVNQSASVAVGPLPQTVCSGLPASFAVTASGAGPFAYQWRKNAANIGGATGAAFTIASATAVDVGSYDCVVTNSCGSDTSAAAALVVQDSPSIVTQPMAKSHAAGLSATFAVVAAGSSPISYQWRKDTIVLSNGGVISGATSASLTISPLDLVDAGGYDCVVTNPCGTTTSDAAVLTVTHCPADLDNGSGAGVIDGGVDVNDLLYFLAQFQAGGLGADVDDGTGTGTRDGGVDINDLLFFLNHFQAGC